MVPDAGGQEPQAGGPSSATHRRRRPDPKWPDESFHAFRGWVPGLMEFLCSQIQRVDLGAVSLNVTTNSTMALTA